MIHILAPAGMRGPSHGDQHTYEIHTIRLASIRLQRMGRSPPALPTSNAARARSAPR